MDKEVVCVYVCVCVYIYCTMKYYSSVDGHVGSFHILAIMNIPAVNIEMHVSLQITVFLSFG